MLNGEGALDSVLEFLWLFLAAGLPTTSYTRLLVRLLA